MLFLGDAMATYTMSCSAYSAAGGGYTNLGTLTQDIDADTIAVKDTIAYKTYASGYLFNYVRPYGQTPVRLYADDTINLSTAGTNVMAFYFVVKTYIEAFAWTDNDAVKIAKGALSSNLTAAAYNSFYQKLGAMKELTRVTYYANNAVASGDAITAAKMNTLASGIYQSLYCLYGSPNGGSNSVQKAFDAATYSKITSGKPITAEILATGEYSLKNMLNRIILALRP